MTYRVLVLTNEGSPSVPWATEQEVAYEVGTEAGLATFSNGSVDLRPDAVLVDLTAFDEQRARALVARCRALGLPVMGVLAPSGLTGYDPSLNLDDFILRAFQPGELLLRLRQVILRNGGGRDQKVIRVGDLIINTERYEVTLAGKRVLLTYKEY